MKTIILLRGLSRDARHWGNFPSLLKKSLEDKKMVVKIIALDLPGFGVRGDVPAPLKLIDGLKLVRNQIPQEMVPPYHVVGLSLGGMMALTWAQNYPQEISELTLINSSSNLSPFYIRFLPKNYFTIFKLIFYWATKNYLKKEEIVLKLTSNKLNPTVQKKTLLEDWSVWAQNTSLKNTFHQLFSAASFKPQSILKCKIKILCSKGDKLVSYKASQKLVEHFQCKLATHPTAGHDLPLDDPDWTIQQIINHE